MNSQLLPLSLRTQHNSIERSFAVLREKYADRPFIPTDPRLLCEIADFLLSVLECIKDGFENVQKRKSLSRFLKTYYHEFYYGPDGDDENFLDTDDPSTDFGGIFMHHLNDIERVLTRRQIELIRGKILRIRKNLASQIAVEK